MKLTKSKLLNIYLPAILILIVYIIFTVMAAGFNTTSEKPEEGLHFKDKQGIIRVEATGFSNEQGSAIFYLANKQEFEESSTDVKSVKVPITNDKALAVFENVQYGEYVILALHDENGNGSIDFNKNNIPVESLGYSSKTGSITGPMNFPESKFTLNKPEIDLKIKMQSF